MLFRKTFVCLLVALFCINTSFAKPPKILVFGKTTSFYHESIPDGMIALQKIGRQLGIDVDTTRDAAVFTTENLKQYAAVVFVNTADASSTLLTEAQRNAFVSFIQSGKGFVGIHAAADAEYNWPWYNKLVGAYFKSHPKQQEATIRLEKNNFNAISGLPESFRHFDEWYNYKETNWDSVQVILTVDEKSYEGGENGNFHPICWYHKYDGGRAFYLGLGHTKECYTDSTFLKILTGGVLYALNNREP